MNRLEKMLSKWNFKKIAVWYLVLAVITGVLCGGTVGYLYRQRLKFAWQYARLEEAKTPEALRMAADKTAAASEDVVDILVVDENQQILYSAKDSKFAAGPLTLTKVGDAKKYLASADYPEAVFLQVKGDEFMLNSIVSHDFGKIRSEYDDESAFENGLSAKTVYMLNRVQVRKAGGTAYVITRPTSVPGGETALKVTAALAMLLVCVYWVLVALWMYRDAARCKLSPLYWGLIGLFTNLIGLIVYKIYKHSATLCPACGAAQSAGHLYCSFCGAQLGARCANCGGKVGAKDSFCHHCGNKIK
ncbi:MAG: zinc ribbon domain-containing protein [Clostridiales bacterium]|nr:zinc ribbon domain-containing protein [Clostridiales bacterium]MDD6931247.1 zinc ribbon domain-containing protein [Eubacteriales bacterium]